MTISDKERIESLFDKEIRPYIRSHGGEVIVEDLSGGGLTLKLAGQCSDCPSASYTARYMIEDKLKTLMPQVMKVELDDSTDQDLLDQAKAILSVGRR